MGVGAIDLHKERKAGWTTCINTPYKITLVSCTVSDLGLATDVTALSSDTFARPTFPPGARQVHGERGAAAAAAVFAA